VLTARGLPAAARYLQQGQAIDSTNLDVINAAVRITRRLGRLEESTALAEYVMMRDPVSVTGGENLAYAYAMSGRLDDAVVQFRRLLELSPGSSEQHRALGEVLLLKGDPVAALAEIHQEPDEDERLVGLSMAYHTLNRRAESDAALDELIKKHEQTMIYPIAYVLAWRGERDRAFEWLEKAVEYDDGELSIAPVDPMLRSLHSDTRWLPFLRKHDMAPEQLAAIKFDVAVPK